ncbi:hypothetical protein Vretimale_1923 [Volvox reticuliferus]|uniref:Uncharacterized protein n=1 Tax=Volvox reticuliferus TaxID=1737510 RepID=A0A8J4CZD2_9CHLO|nr:hypothetical protein Vretifemale_17306 [Volvox reticuliferus]GIL96016.1 hypothetical protein Vretimale_1923 [Volvox reticuliferus]
MDFLTWLINRGGQVHPKLDLFYTLPSGDRGVVARSDIPEGQLLLLLPIDCAIYIPTKEEFQRHPDAFPNAVQYLREAHPGLSPFLATTLVLMSEMTRGSTSPWASYIATLPPSCPDCLLNWTDEEKRELAGTSLEQPGPDPASDVYLRLVAPILALRKDLWPGLVVAETVEADRGSDPGLTAFLRAAGLVQSRAFHLEAENWVSGAKEISRLEDGGTQVFLLPGIDMINHSHNPARRNAHLERLNLAQAAAAKLLDGTALAEAQSPPTGVEAFFVMRTDKPIKAGEEVLHTYGNLSDAQLLQTYGFLDSEDDFRLQTASGAAAAASSEGPSPKKRAKAGDGGDIGGGDAYRNPYNAALVPWTTVDEVCRDLLLSMDQNPSASLQRAKRKFLASAGVLQSVAPELTQFVLLAREPLPDELMTAVQVLLMTGEEFQELQREFGGPTKLPAGSKKVGKGSQDGGTTSKAAPLVAATGAEEASIPKLSLGTTLLEEDDEFAEMVCIASLQILAACMERYPTDVKDDVRLLRSPDCTGRKRLAVRVRLGEKDVLHLAKKAMVELMKRLRAASAGEGCQAEENEESDDEVAAAEAEGAEELGRRRASKRQRRGLGAPPSEEADGAEDDENSNSADGSDGEDGSDSDDEAAHELLMGSDDSDKVGYGAVEYDDGIGEVHDRGKPHEAPKDD